MRTTLSLLLIAGFFGSITPVSALAADTLTRAEAVALLVEANAEQQETLARYRQSMPPVPLFQDVQQHQWYAPYIETAFHAGIVHGTRDGFFRPGSLLSGTEAALLLSRSWVDHSPLLLYQWMRGEYYTPTLDDVAAAYRLPSGPQPVSRERFLQSVRSLYGASAVDTLPASAMAWRGTVAVAAAASSSASSARPAPIQGAPSLSAEERPRGWEGLVTQLAQAAEPSAASSSAPSQPAVRAASTDAFTISMPALGITNLAVSHPENPFTHNGLLAPLQSGVGHLFGFPGAGGTVLIYGHSSSYPWDVSPYTKIFRRINELQQNDVVRVTYEGRIHDYRVTEKKTVPARDMTTYQDDGDGERLILYTCWPPDSIRERYLVIATPI